MRNILGSTLWVGHVGDLLNIPLLYETEIQAIVEVADSEPSATLPRDFVRCRFPLSDGGENPAWILRLARDTVAALLQEGVKTLVCCSVGINRSLCVAASALAKFRSEPFKEVLLRVAQTGPADVSPGLIRDFQSIGTL